MPGRFFLPGIFLISTDTQEFKMHKTIFISNGQKTLRCSEGQVGAFTSQKDGEGNPVWVVVDDPNPPVLSKQEIAINDHTDQICIRHNATGKECWCDKGQLESMLATGWSRKGAVSPAKSTAAPVSEVAQQDALKFQDAADKEASDAVASLRKVLEELPRDEDKYWKSNGEINITGLREIVPNVTRKEVDEAYPGLTRTK